ncbi:hypothetical protein B0H65DRAFT_303809 [Neurospora tetraspora]|uniref:Uncharacterized protein n=1 Tax=Neurospora tetraspora TaxID=94610 RepID=A0AAE0JAA8_9PEZI|nr:hypothetical protein B0H65DRAFT_303809 [Neurospora tetraspora]
MQMSCREPLPNALVQRRQEMYLYEWLFPSPSSKLFIYKAVSSSSRFSAPVFASSTFFGLCLDCRCSRSLLPLPFLIVRIAKMTRKGYYTRCSCPAGKLSAPGVPEFLVTHIHLPPQDKSSDSSPPHRADMTRQNPGVPCQCSTGRTRLPGRPDIIGLHFHGLSPTNTGDREASTLAEDAANFNKRDEGDIWWAGKGTQDS